jgi:uncharacterized membrane protein
MQAFLKFGRCFFAAAIIGFGIIQFVTGAFMSAFLPLPPNTFLLSLVSTLFVLGGLAICFNRTARGGALIVAGMFFVFMIHPHLTSLLQDVHNAGLWAVFAEAAGICAGALIIRGIFIEKPSVQKNLLSSLNNILIARILLAMSLTIVGVQHFLYAEYIARLIAAWIPFKLFWTYFIGLAFILTAASLITNIKTRLACTLMGFMFLFFVLFLHLPRVITSSYKETECSSLFVAMAFCGTFLLAASVFKEKLKS